MNKINHHNNQITSRQRNILLLPNITSHMLSNQPMDSHRIAAYHPCPATTQPQRSSLRWLWITLAIVGGILVLGCGGCIIASVAGLGIFGRAVSTAIAPSTTANSYYNAIKKQDYATAFTYLDISGASVEGQQVSKDAFIILGQTIDATKGTVSSFSQSGISLNTNTSSGTTATITMDVTRNGSTYTVHLELRQENNVWKITSVDNI